MINFTNSVFVKSVSDYSLSPKELNKEVLIVGKSNVGKSTLINALTGQKSLAYTSNKPGHTKLLNFYNIDNKFYLVDAPGYGYAVAGLDLNKLFKEMIDTYFQKNKNLKFVLVLMDSRREIGENDFEIIDYLMYKNIKFKIIFTKTDKLNQSEKSLLNKRINDLKIDKDKVFLVSSFDSNSISLIKKEIEKDI